MKLTKEVLKLDIIKRGKFILKSGQASDYYIDMKKVFGSPKTFRQICDELCQIIDPVKRPGRHGASKKATCVAGSGHGGLPLATAVAIKLGLPLILVRDRVKKHGIQKMIDGYMPTKKDNVVIVDDIFTTGTCISNIAEVLKETKSKVLAGYVVVSRGDVVGFKIPVKSLLSIKDLV